LSATPLNERTLRAWQGLQRDYGALQISNNDGTPAAGIFASSTTLLAQIWEGQSQQALAMWTPAWATTNPVTGATQTGFAQGQFSLSILPAYIANLDVDGEYKILVTAVTNGVSSPVWEGVLKILATPGFTSPSPPGLVTYDACVGLLSTSIRLTDAQIDAIPFLIAEASTLVRKEMGQRDFNRQTYSEEYTAQLNGFVALKQMPVNKVTRIQGYLQTALVITASSSVFSSAFVEWITTGDWGSGTLAYTGITLVSFQDGVQTQTPFLFASFPTIQQLATAVGSTPGWAAFTSGNLGNFGTATDLAMASTGTAQGAMDGDGCELLVYSEDLATTKLDNAIGFLWTGRRRISSAFGGRWGEDGGDLADMDSPSIGRVRVTYDAGFDVVPEPVQRACIELVKISLNQLKMNEVLATEKAGDVSYSVTPDMWAAIPPYILQRLSKYKMPHAS
jgi:hypothetical protein